MHVCPHTHKHTDKINGTITSVKWLKDEKLEDPEKAILTWLG
jgi:hypothetical protein